MTLTRRSFPALMLAASTPLLALVAPMPSAQAQDFMRRVERMREASRQPHPVVVPAGTRVLRDIAYGTDPAQRFDAYLPQGTRAAPLPVVFYVHGGGWANGDKTNPGVENKLDYWLPRGYAVISSNYRMLPGAKPLEQAKDIAVAVAAAQERAGEWGLDASRFVLMGHSAGAHLVALLGAKPELLSDAHARRPKGVVTLDGAAFDVAGLMSQARVPQLYRDAFGSDKADWAAASPLDQLSRGALPMLVVCSSTRRFPAPPCDEGRAFARKAATFGVPVQVLPEPMAHGPINHDLGLPSAYTDAVGTYIERLVERSVAP